MLTRHQFDVTLASEEGDGPPPTAHSPPETMNVFTLLLGQQVHPQHAQESLALIDITPEIAEALLEVNFSDNRTVSMEHVKRMAADMKDGLWVLSNDAVCIDTDGRLINAAHRMNAIKLSGTTQRFIVMWNVPSETAQKLDVGRKRSMHERITISGTRMTVKECAITRHAMNAYEKAALGTVEYAQNRHDKLVEKYFSLHSEFLQALNAKQMTGSAFIKSAALKMFVEMTHYHDKHSFKHEMPAFERSMLFVDLVENGFSRTGIPIGPSEHSAIKLKNMKERRKADSKGNYWADKDAFMYTCSMAFKFMTGEVVENVSKYKTDPFMNFLEAPGTNGQFNMPTLDS